MSSSEELFTKIGELVDKAMKENFSGKESHNWPYESIEDYKAKTGKKFRMTKRQKESGMTREQAFAEFMDNMVKKS